MEEKKIKKPEKTNEKKSEKIVRASSKQSFEGQTMKSRSADSKGLIAVIRITGEVKVKPEIVNTLNRLRLMRKYSCILINSSNKALMGMLWKIRHSVAYGDIDKEMLVKLLKERGKRMASSDFNKSENLKDAAKADYEKAATDLINGKKLEEIGFKPFFRLHPPRKGIKSKRQYPIGVLGNNRNDINKLIERML